MKKFIVLICCFAVLTLLICIFMAPSVALADDGTQSEPEPSAGAKIRDWVYTQAEPLVAGISSSAVIGAIFTIVGAVIQRKIKNRIAANTDGTSALAGNIKTLYTSTKTILAEVKELKEAIESEVTTLKKLKKVEDVAAVEAQIQEVIEQTEKVSTETQSLATPFLRS